MNWSNIKYVHGSHGIVCNVIEYLVFKMFTINQFRNCCWKYTFLFSSRKFTFLFFLLYFFFFFALLVLYWCYLKHINGFVCTWFIIFKLLLFVTPCLCFIFLDAKLKDGKRRKANIFTNQKYICPKRTLSFIIKETYTTKILLFCKQLISLNNISSDRIVCKVSRK